MLAFSAVCTGFMLDSARLLAPVSRASATVAMGYGDPPEPWPRVYEGVSESMRMAYARESKRMGTLAAFTVYREEIVDAWNKADADGDDMLDSAEELGECMSSMGEPLEEEELAAFWARALNDGGSKLRWVQFTKAWADTAKEIGSANEPEKKGFFGLF